MSAYLLDTNCISELVRAEPTIVSRNGTDFANVPVQVLNPWEK